MTWHETFAAALVGGRFDVRFSSTCVDWGKSTKTPERKKNEDCASSKRKDDISGQPGPPPRGCRQGSQPAAISRYVYKRKVKLFVWYNPLDSESPVETSTRRKTCRHIHRRRQPWLPCCWRHLWLPTHAKHLFRRH